MKLFWILTFIYLIRNMGGRTSPFHIPDLIIEKFLFFYGLDILSFIIMSYFFLF